MPRMLATVFLLLLFTGPLSGQERRLQPADFYKEITIQNVALSPTGELVAFTVMTVNEEKNKRYREVWMQRLTAFNDTWLAKITRMPAERLTWKVTDGTQIEGWMIKPVGYDPDRKYPLVLKIHGGPHGAYGNYFFRTFHVLPASGFFVLYPNPRGSTGYGHDFIYATRSRWGE